jgi:hypothetical protein
MVSSLVRVLAVEGFVGPMEDRISMVVRTLLAALGCDGDEIASEARWATEIPIGTEWASAEVLLDCESTGQFQLR